MKGWCVMVASRIEIEIDSGGKKSFVVYVNERCAGSARSRKAAEKLEYDQIVVESASERRK